ncbi:putative polyketide synthase [Tieghemostelium lacteum]|uniref:Putative polyketide synthase n=1 Tax=Tieghemostelium lacteum TaxID=361077 RepID=A0A152A7E7_TIELA|nr:putative polyketide synthase [Tieghemostelium lacteum]|eukprot:KYR01977.1 putative polyketide synthase [Tieghemostelium lacteum]
MTPNDNDIAIVGIGCRLPGNSNSPLEFWNNLQNSQKPFDGIRDIPNERWSKSFSEQGVANGSRAGLIDMSHWKNFDSMFFGVSPKDSSIKDPQERLLLMVLWEALEDAHIQPSSLRGSDTSVFIGSMHQDYASLEEETSVNYFGKITISSALSNLLSFHYDFRGASMTLDTACSSSLNAVQLGCQSILTGQSEVSVCGGVNALLDPAVSIAYTKLGLLGKLGISRTFDAEADGYVRGEGAGLVILKKLSKAIKDQDRIYCVIKGSRSNSDGQNHKNFANQPSKQSQFENISQTIKLGGVSAGDIQFFEAHGTSTPVGDPIEVEALSMVFKENHSKDKPLYIGSLKSNIGHTESTSGVASLIKVAMMLKHRKLVPNANFRNPNPKIDFEGWNVKVATQPIDIIPYQKDKGIVMGLNCFGLYGSNCCVILQEFLDTRIQNENNYKTKEYLIPFSVNSQVSFDKYHQSIVDIIENQNDSDEMKQQRYIDFVQYQCQSKEHQLKERIMLTCKDWNDFKNKRNMVSQSSQISFDNSKPSIVFVFCGQGPQWKGMGEQLYNTNSVFRQSVDKCDLMLQEYFGYSILQQLRLLPEEDKDQLIHQPILAQPSLFLIQYALIELLKSWGIRPDASVGHSFGELASALCSNIISLSSAVKIVYHRAIGQQKTVGSGRMLSIGFGTEKYNEFKQKYSHVEVFNELEIACYNSPDSIVLTGTDKNIEIVKDLLQRDGIFAAMLGTHCSFHSSKQDPIRDEFIQGLSDLPPSMKPEIPYFSTVSGDQMDGDSFYDAEYVFQNIRKPVIFDEAVQNIFNFLQSKNGNGNDRSTTVFIEISPHPTLSFYIPKSIESKNENDRIVCLPTLNRKKQDVPNIQLTLSELFFNGVQLNFNSGQFESTDSNGYKDRVGWVPKYQWDSKEFWKAPKVTKKLLIPSTDILGQQKSSGNVVFEVVIDLRKPAFQFLKGHISRGQYLFPGCGYIDIILKQYPKQDLTIYNLSFEKPIKISEDIPVILQTSIQSTMTRNEFRIDFYYRYSNKDSWVRSTHGRFGLHSLDYSLTQHDISRIQQECSFTTIYKKDVYERLSQIGLPYGPSFQKIHSILVGNNTYFGIADATNTFDSYYFNAATLDSACHCGLTLLEPPQDIVFESVSNLKYYPSNMTSDQPTILYTYGKPLSNHLADKNSSLVNIVNPTNGKTIVQFIGKTASLIRVKNKSQNLFKMKYPTKNIYQTYWQPYDSVLSPPLLINNSDNNNIQSGIHQLFNNLTISSTSKHLIKIIYLDNNSNQQQSLIHQIVSRIESTIQSQQNHSKLEIEFTCLTLDSQNIDKTKYQHTTIKTRSLINGLDQFDIEKEFLNTSNYDLVVLPMMDNQHSLINPLIFQLKRLLLPSGWLMIIDQQAHQSEGNGHVQHEEPLTLLSNDKLSSFLDTIGFQNIQYHQPTMGPLVIRCQNEPLFTNTIMQNEQGLNYIFTSQSPNIEEMKSNLQSLFRNQKTIVVDCNNEVEYEHFKMSAQQLKENDLIFFYGCDQHLTKDNYLNVTDDYIKLDQFFHKIGFKGKYILLTLNSQGENTKCYFNSSIIGAFKYLISMHIGDPYSFDFDEDSIKSFEFSQLSRILSLVDNHERDFVIRDGVFHIQRILRDHHRTSTPSYETDPKNLCLKCDSKLNFQLHSKKSLRPNEIEVQVMATGINFKDVIFYRGLLPPGMYPEGYDIYNPPFGLECSGIVTRIGNDCKRFKIGDHVYGLIPNTLASHAIGNELHFILKPDNINWIQAASILLVYTTSNYCISQLGNSRSVLIHSACGGVGLSALNILKWKQFKGKVFVSCGSPEKEEYLRKHYGDMITDYFNSRNHKFSTKIKEQYGGVDFIVNTLSGDFLSSNFNCLTNAGRIIDLSVTHIIENETLDLGQFHYSKGYQTVDVYHLLMNDNNTKIFEEVNEAIAKGELDLIPIREFQCNQGKEAIEEIGKSKHIGKLVVNLENLNELVFNPMIQQMKDDHQHIPKDEYQLTNLKETLLITGQTGITIPIIKWILQRCSPELRNIVVLSISPLKWELEWLINYCISSKPNLRIHFQQCDVSSKDEIKSSLDKIQSRIGMKLTIKSVFHAAIFYTATPFAELNMNELLAAHKPKAFGALNLHELSLELQWPLDNFILFSSVAIQLGEDKDGPYTTSSWLIDSLAKYRKSIGLPGISINFGPMGGAGVVSRREVIARNLLSLGLLILSLPKILGGMDLCLNNEKSLSNFYLCEVDYSQIYIDDVATRPKIEHLIDKPDHLLQKLSDKQIVNKNISNSSKKQAYDTVISIITELLSIEPSSFNPDLKLKEYGIDSLLTSQYQGKLFQHFPDISNLFSHQHLVSNSTTFIIEKLTINK